MLISEILVLVGTFFGPCKERLINHKKVMVFENLKVHKVFCDG